MYKPKIKICGLRSLEDIQLINCFPVDYAGFIFAESVRQVTVEEASSMRRLLRPDIQAVGVFLDMPIEEINQIAAMANLDRVQFHGHETDEECKRIQKPVWKTIPVQERRVLLPPENFPHADGILFDTCKNGKTGGTGKAFLWDAVRTMPNTYFTILAGGLKEENICEAVKAVKPHVLDINSGAEEKGRKSREKLEKILRSVEYGI